MGDLDNDDCLFGVRDGIDDTVSSLAEAILLPAGQFFAADGSGIIG